MIEFTLPFEEHKLEIFIHPNQEEMDIATGDENLWGAFAAYAEDPLPETIGALHFSQQELGAGLFAHEITHVLFHLLEFSHKQYDIETICDIMYDATKTFWNEYYNKISDTEYENLKRR